ncbi:MAG: hypothetical protein IT436_01790 [Phycisphaerales bacterium]|nr:hypothetical protein [Phycisphaerales bacterium]
MTHPDHNASLTQTWTLDHGGRLELGGLGGPGGRPGAAATGTITPIAASGWIYLSEVSDDSLEARALEALSLTQVLDRLEARFPGYRWFIRDRARPIAA